MANELKPCPFCGGNSISFRSTPDMDTDGKFHCVSCNECGAKSREKFAMDACPLFYEELRNQWNTRPAPVEGFERYDISMFGNGAVEMGGGEYVRYDQAEAIIAVKDEKINLAETSAIEMHQELNKLEANNAALTARIRRLELDNAKLEDRLSKEQESHSRTGASRDKWRERTEALETQIAAARKALKSIADAPAWGFPEKWETTPAEVRQLARAALEAKP